MLLNIQSIYTLELTETDIMRLLQIMELICTSENTPISVPIELIEFADELGLELANRD